VTDDKSNYRQIFKATSIFGGVQVFQIIISVIRSKVIAVLLGPAGMGVSGLLTATTSMISGLTNFGLGISAVKNISVAYNQEDPKKIATVVSTIKKLVWITGLLGSLITLFLSSWLSRLTFGNTNYTYAFIFLSITLLMTQLSVGQNALLQGTRNIKYLAKSNLISSFIGLIVTIPLYYLFKLNGIVPAIIVSVFITLCISFLYSSKIKYPYVKLSLKELQIEGKEMLVMGFVLSLSGIITLGVSYIVRLYIGRDGGIEEVGFYNAGFAIINTYVGLVFTSMSTDYYPRLSAVSHNNKLASEEVNKQAEIAILILSPILMIFFVFIKYAVVLLYSSKFIVVEGMIQWAAIGMYFRAASWCLSYFIVSKSASKLFFINELIANVYFLVLNLIFYKFFGLNGLGMSFIIGYLLYFIQLYIVCKNKYQFYFSRSFKENFLIQLLLGLICFSIVKFTSATIHYTLGSILILLSLSISIRFFDKILDINELYRKLRNKN